jgi:hypothetical protein
MAEEKKPSTEEELKTLRQTIEDLKTELRGGREASDRDIIDRELALVGKIDPFSESRRLKIIKDVPPSEQFPQGRTWVRWDDPIVKNLHEFVANPPQKGDGQIDSIIRRGDAGLAWIRKDIADARLLKNELESARMRGQLSEKQRKKLGHGVSMYGDGLQRDEEGAKIHAPVKEFTDAEHAVHNMHKNPQTEE